MKFDLRLPIGLIFTLYGAILSLYGLFGGTEQYGRSLGINVNRNWGLLLLAFGILMLFMASRRGGRQQ
jgi:hypothetical protein